MEVGSKAEESGSKPGKAVLRMTELEMQSRNRADNKSYGPKGAYTPHSEPNLVSEET